jgi:MazG family protein
MLTTDGLRRSSSERDENTFTILDLTGKAPLDGKIPQKKSRYNAPMTGAKFEKLVEIMATLRGPNGCPWDKQQDARSLKPMLVEETYEVLEAIDLEDYQGLTEELGDVLLHIVFHAQLGREAGRFDIDSIIEAISDKLVRRHPHVFGNEDASSAEEVVKNWEAIKAREKAARLENRSPDERSLLEGIPSKLPAIHEAHQISARAARAGFDWPDIQGIFEKLTEETRELREAMSASEDAGRSERVEDEIGDILFCIVNIARRLNVDSESALKRSNRKFKARFRHMESALAAEGRTLEQTSLEDMEALWQKAKAETRKP